MLGLWMLCHTDTSHSWSCGQPAVKKKKRSLRNKRVPAKAECLQNWDGVWGRSSLTLIHWHLCPCTNLFDPYFPPIRLVKLSASAPNLSSSITSITSSPSAKHSSPLRLRGIPATSVPAQHVHKYMAKTWINSSELSWCCLCNHSINSRFPLPFPTEKDSAAPPGHLKQSTNISSMHKELQVIYWNAQRAPQSIKCSPATRAGKVLEHSPPVYLWSWQTQSQKSGCRGRGASRRAAQQISCRSLQPRRSLSQYGEKGRGHLFPVVRLKHEVNKMCTSQRNPKEPLTWRVMRG